MKKLVTYSILTLLFVGAFFFSYIKLSAATTGEPAPEFEATLIDGSDFKLSDLRGSYVLLVFWGSWCQPCRQENPRVVRLKANLGDQLQLVSIALEKNKAAGKKASIQDGFTWKHQIIEETPFVLLSSIARKYGVTSIPTKILIDPSGHIMEAETIEEIEAILGQ